VRRNGIAEARTYRGGGVAVVADHDELVAVVRARHHALVRRHLCAPPALHAFDSDDGDRSPSRSEERRRRPPPCPDRSLPLELPLQQCDGLASPLLLHTPLGSVSLKLVGGALPPRRAIMTVRCGRAGARTSTSRRCVWGRATGCSRSICRCPSFPLTHRCSSLAFFFFDERSS
jgi:hypothetical protein